MKKPHLLAFTLVLALTGMAQQIPPIPLNPNCHTGVLPNGLTYYIQHNDWPEHRADFYIAQKVGSIQEEDNQRGLAHFLEHMCFNGTTHFPKDQLKNYLETIGVRFGENLNAYTSTEETVYNINNVPVQDHPGAIDSCLLILHDWSHDLSLDGDEIDKERGVINEEWRMRQSAQMRIFDQVFPIVYKGSKFAERLPIGTMDVVMNFPHKVLRDYYHQWYRPENQGIVVVGDIDVAAVEQKIKDIFADIPATQNGSKVEAFPVPDNAEPLFAVGKDKEQTNSQLIIMWKQDPVERGKKRNVTYILTNYVKSAIESMLSTRYAELLQKPNPPFIYGGAGYSEYLISKTKDAFQAVALFPDNAYETSVKALYRELLRAKRYGFTQSEYTRFKDELKSSLENQYEQRNKISNTRYCQEYYRHFLDNEPATGIEYTYQIMPTLADQIPVEIINQAIREETFDNDSNLVFLYMLPEKEGIVLPQQDDIMRYINEVRNENIEAYTENVSTEPLVNAKKLKGSKVISTEDSQYDSQVLTLKNGIKVWVKKTDYKPNNISFRAISHGGLSMYSDEEYLNADEINLVPIGGYGQFSAVDLEKKLAGKNVDVNIAIGQDTEGLSGSCVTKDLETELQLIYLYFTAPRKDLDAYTSQIERAKASLKNAELQPTTTLQDSIISVVYKNNPRALRTKVEDLDRLNYDRIIQMYQERFADANDFQYYFVGDIDIDAARPLFEKYLGSLPVKKGNETAQPISLRMTKGEVTNIFQKQQEVPSAIVAFFYHTNDFKYNSLKEILTLEMLEQVLDMTFTNDVREENGGAYGVPTNSGATDFPEEMAQLIIQLPTAPAKRAEMTDIIYKCIDNMVKNGPNTEYFEKTKQYLHRSHDEHLKSNSYWLARLVDKTFNNRDLVTDYDKTVDEITTADVQDLARRLFASGNRLEVGMTYDE